MPKALAAFCEAFRAGDLARLAALLLDHAVVEVVSATSVHGPVEAGRPPGHRAAVAVPGAPGRARR